jgi:hypothetical protein
MRGLTKVAHLTPSMKWPDLLAVSLYNMRPVHLLSMMAMEVRWIMKEWVVWCAEVQKNARLTISTSMS